jgi:hypothetical protein
MPHAVYDCTPINHLLHARGIAEIWEIARNIAAHSVKHGICIIVASTMELLRSTTAVLPLSSAPVGPMAGMAI